jgi:integrase
MNSTIVSGGESQFAERIDSFIAHKKTLGNRYDSEKALMGRFNRFCADYYASESALTLELAEAWVSRHAGEKPGSQAKRCCIIRQFAIFLTKSGENAYVLPPVQGNPSQGFVPYIFTNSEINAILCAADSIKPGNISPCAHEVIPMILRLLYGCGLRASEACNLRKSNVDLRDGILTIFNAKNRKDRLVPMSESLAKRLSGYIDRISFIRPGAEYVFPSPKSEHIQPVTVYDRFREILFQAGIPHRGREKGPCLHSLRHTFAVHSLRKMEADGVDLYCALPVLSTYMGHENIYATERYLRIVSFSFFCTRNSISVSESVGICGFAVFTHVAIRNLQYNLYYKFRN